MSKPNKVSLIIILMLMPLGFLLWTADTDYHQMSDEYLDHQSQFITLNNGLRIHVRDTGGAEKPTILMIHGTSDSLLTWSAITPALANKYRLVSLDLPGHGFSTSPDTMSYELFVSTIEQFLNLFDIESVTIMGNSLGRGIAWHFALEHSDLVNGLILLNPSGAPRTEKSKSNLGFKILGNPVGRFIGRHITPRALIEKSLLGSVTDPSLVGDKLINRYWHLLRLPGNRQALAKFAMMPRSDASWARVNEITAPTLIVWGEEDTIIPASSGQQFLRSMTNVELLIYANIGHLPMIESPVRLAKDIDNFMQYMQQE